MSEQLIKVSEALDAMSDQEFKELCKKLAAETVSGVEREVCEDIARRQKGGVAKYGLAVADNPLGLKAWLQHAYEECLDHAVYLKRAIKELE